MMSCLNKKAATDTINFTSPRESPKIVSVNLLGGRRYGDDKLNKILCA